MTSLIIQDISQLPAIASSLVNKIKDYNVVGFYGPMGSGKTTLIRAISEAMGVKNIVTSPTFTLINEYLVTGGKTIYHFDLYRLKKVEELYDVGYEDYFFSDNYCFIEWPEIAENIMPPHTLKIYIKVNDDLSRNILISE